MASSEEGSRAPTPTFLQVRILQGLREKFS